MKNLALKATNIAVSYRRRAGILRWSQYWALHDVSFDLRRGETLGIIGRNGSGKSSLLRVLAGIIAPDHGNISRNVSSASLLSLQVGFIPHLTGRENALLSGMLMGMRRADIAQRISAILEFSELGEFIDQPVRTYSSGMRARLGFSVAVQADPDILLIDEVLGVGDAVFREKSALALEQRIRSDKTVVLVSHSMPMLKKLCDRVLWIDHGVSRSIDDTDQVIAEYLGESALKKDVA